MNTFLLEVYSQANVPVLLLVWFSVGILGSLIGIFLISFVNHVRGEKTLLSKPKELLNQVAFSFLIITIVTFIVGAGLFFSS
jgi:H+/Cl- antiporter ClcA